MRKSLWIAILLVGVLLLGTEAGNTVQWPLDSVTFTSAFGLRDRNPAGQPLLIDFHRGVDFRGENKLWRSGDTFHTWVCAGRNFCPGGRSRRGTH